jgi:hypothetical protein
MDDLLRACVQTYGLDWEKSLSYAEFSYNNNYQASLQMTAFEALYGRKCLLTPKNGTGKGLTCGLSLVMKYHSARKDLLRGFGKGACGRQYTITRQGNCLRV